MTTVHHMYRALACVASAGYGFSGGRPVIGNKGGLVAGWIAGEPAA